jgi:TldD protein
MGACSASLSQYQGKLTEMAISTAEKVIRLLESKPSPEGHFDIVTSPLITGLFVHEIVGHSMEADSVIDKRSVFKDKIGKKVAPEFVTIVDDPTQDGLYGSFSFDDEGTPGRRKFLIRNGEVETFLHTVETAGKMNANPNGSGRAETYSSIPLPRMSNTFMLSGNWNDDELVKETKEGVYCSGEAIGRVNPVKGTFSIKVEEAFLLRDGENVRNLVGPTILGSIRHTIHDIDAVAKNVQSNHPSICEKQGQRVPVSYGGPLVRIRKMLIR